MGFCGTVTATSVEETVLMCSRRVDKDLKVQAKNIKTVMILARLPAFPSPSCQQSAHLLHLCALHCSAITVMPFTCAAAVIFSFWQADSARFLKTSTVQRAERKV
ncbi:hypothetical protein ILYODFUR_035940 [Ilyodon furcidens]|uniref:Uncharacterized protein n=1 Tax=Ilyodon furcidens TaxID=33524 RepID=A0ABV0U0I5_9TELE